MSHLSQRLNTTQNPNEIIAHLDNFRKFAENHLDDLPQKIDYVLALKRVENICQTKAINPNDIKTLKTFELLDEIEKQLEMKNIILKNEQQKGKPMSNQNSQTEEKSIKKDSIQKQKNYIEHLKETSSENTREKEINKLNLMVDDLETNGEKISQDNIHLYYQFMSDEDLEKYSYILDDIFDARLDIFKNEISNIEYEELSSDTEYGFNITGLILFGTKDTLKPIDEYIAEIKGNTSYLNYLLNDATFEITKNEEGIYTVNQKNPELNVIKGELPDVLDFISSINKYKLENNLTNLSLENSSDNPTQSVKDCLAEIKQSPEYQQYQTKQRIYTLEQIKTFQDNWLDPDKMSNFFIRTNENELIEISVKYNDEREIYPTDDAIVWITKDDIGATLKDLCASVEKQKTQSLDQQAAEHKASCGLTQEQIQNELSQQATPSQTKGFTQ